MSFASVFDRANPSNTKAPLNDGVPAPVVEFWARVELMGHRIRYGHVREVEMFGAKLMQVDVHNSEGVTTEFYGGSSIYCVRPISEAEARRLAEPYRPQVAAITHDDDIDEVDDDHPF